jgi:hypothetical protein
MGNKTSLLFSVTTVNSMSVSANLTVRATMLLREKLVKK